jgi:hypothetical protein
MIPITNSYFVTQNAQKAAEGNETATIILAVGTLIGVAILVIWLVVLVVRWIFNKIF